MTAGPAGSGVEWRPDPFGRFDERLFVGGIPTDQARRHIGGRVRVFEDAPTGTVALTRLVGARTAPPRAALGALAAGAGAVVAGLLSEVWLLALVGVAFLAIGGSAVGRARRREATPPTALPGVVPPDRGAAGAARSAPTGHFFDPSQSSWSRRAEAWRRDAEVRPNPQPRSVRPPGLPGSEAPQAHRLPPDEDIIDVDPE